MRSFENSSRIDLPIIFIEQTSEFNENTALLIMSRTVRTIITLHC